MNNIIGLWECPHCERQEPRDEYDGDAPFCEGCKETHGAIVEMRRVGDDGEELVTDGGTVADDSECEEEQKTYLSKLRELRDDSREIVLELDRELEAELSHLKRIQRRITELENTDTEHPGGDT